MDAPREPSGEVTMVGRRPARGRFLQTPAAIAVVLLIVYGLVGLLFDPAGHLSTDAGGKAASVAAMVGRGDHDPDMGYWFAERDPDGRLHPFAGTVRTADGQWINTTSLTMVMASRPLWAIGGPRLALLLPMLGAVGAALAAGALERGLRRRAGLRPGNGHRSVWIVGLATPVTVYALDFWEHSLGLAGMLWGIVAVLHAVDHETGSAGRETGSAGWEPPSGRERRRRWYALVAGVAFGLASTMRQEAMVYGAVAGLVLVAVSVRGVGWRRGWRAAIGRGAAMSAGFVLVTVMNVAAEIVLTGGPLRTARAAGTAADAGSGLVDRLQTGLVTLTFPFNDEHPLSYVLGLALLAALIWWTCSETAPSGTTPSGTTPSGTAPSETAPSPGGPDRSLTLARSVTRAVVLCIAAVWLVFGLRFVPGLVPTTPLAVVGAVAAWRRRLGLPLTLALAPVPLVLAVQFTAGALAQWGGRYLLTTGAVLAVSAVALSAERQRRVVLMAAAAGLAVTAYGAAWRTHRSSLVMDDWAALDAAVDPETVVVFFDDHHAREAGPRALERRWLSGFSTEQREMAARLLLAGGEERFVFVMPNGFEEAGLQAGFDGFEARTVVGQLVLFDSRLVPYERTP